MSSIKQSSDQLDRLVAWTFGLAPAALFLLTWSDDFTPLQQMARAFGLPVLAAELTVVLVSFGEGNRLKLQMLPLALLAALAAVAWGTAVTAASPLPAVLRTATWTIHLLFGLALVNLRRHGTLDFDRIVRAQLIGFLLVFVLLVAFVETTAKPQIGASDLPAFGNVRWFGYYAAATIGLCALGFIRGDKFALLAAVAAFAAVFWTGARGGVAAVVAGLVACAILFPQFRSWRVWLLLASVAAVGFVMSLGLEALGPVGSRGPAQIVRFDSTGRVELWQATLTKVLERPLFGWGEGQFVHRWGNFSVAQPHNIVLQLLYVWGVVGTLLCAALAVWMTPLFLKCRTIETAPFRCAALILVAYSFIDGALFYVQSTSLFALCCAAAVAAGPPDNRHASRPTAT
jgi:O-antigen ligase